MVTVFYWGVEHCGLSAIGTNTNFMNMQKRAFIDEIVHLHPISVSLSCRSTSVSLFICLSFSHRAFGLRGL